MKSVQFVESVDDSQVKLDVLVEIGSVTIRPSTGQDIIVDATYRHMDVWLERHGNTIIVRAEQDEAFLQKVSRWFNNDHPKAELNIQVPLHCEINAKTITGSLDIEGIQAAVTGRVITGKLDLSDILGSIYAKTITGKLIYAGALTEENHRFETITGEIQLNLPANTNARLSASTTTGKIRCRLPLVDSQKKQRFVGDKLQGTLGNGAGRIKAKITTGNLLLKPIDEKQPKQESVIAKPMPV